MTSPTEHLWSQYTTAKLAALKSPTPTNDAAVQEALAAFTASFLEADEVAA